MARMMAPLSTVAAQNPFAQTERAYSAEQLAHINNTNYAISIPYSKLLIAQDAVNQSAAMHDNSRASHHRALTGTTTPVSVLISVSRWLTPGGLSLLLSRNPYGGGFKQAHISRGPMHHQL